MRNVPTLAAAALLAASPAAEAQTLAARVASAPDGFVLMQFDSRAGVCGDGRELLSFGNIVFGRNFQSIGGHWNGRCSPGPLRVTITKADGEIIRYRTQVGGPWVSTDARVTDLGVVSPVEASAYFFSLAPQLERRSSRDRLLDPAVLADAANVVDPLFGLARDRQRTENLRRNALLWLGLLDDARPRRMLHTVIEDRDEDADIRSAAIFALANGGDPPAAEFTYLRGLYLSLANVELQEAVIHAMSRDNADGGRWLVARALQQGELMKLRKSALFWAGQGDATPSAELVRVYREADDRSLREHAIFVLSQRKDDAAIDALLRIAREDRDTQMRGKALFWLAQKDDPRVKKLIADLVLR